ncbi:MAG: SAM-dependent methyltransferase, partial [Bacteroidia bacterium]|nr:SAM-dependent methyltransferase [Bacteroidia bacterium]MDW8335273.1 SAM-dependent methyltransferase [Bacteroidia bacterium]
HFYRPFFDFIPYHKNPDGTPKQPTELKSLTVKDDCFDFLLCYLNSSIVWRFFVFYTDVRNVNPGFIDQIPILLLKDEILKAKFKSLRERLMTSYKENKKERYNQKTQTIESLYVPRLSKPIIDEIDVLLGECYGLTGEELDFVINYDAKYRCGD